MNIRNVINISKFTIFHFQQELDIKSHIEKKLKFTEEEKHRVECRLKNTELELKETETSLEQSNSKRKVSWKLRERIEYQNWKQPYPTQPPLSPLPPPKKKNGGTKCYAAASQSALPKGRDDPVPSISAYCRQRYLINGVAWVWYCIHFTNQRHFIFCGNKNIQIQMIAISARNLIFAIFC